MESQQRRMGLIVCIVIALFVSACGANQTPGTPTREVIAPGLSPAAVPSASITPAAPTQAAPMPTSTPAATAKPIAPPPTAAPSNTPPPPGLSANGPWLVYHTETGLAAVNADGSGRTVVLDQSMPLADLPDSAAPSGGWLVARTGNSPLDVTEGETKSLTLNLVHLPDGKLDAITPLFSADMLAAITAAADERTDATEAGIAVTNRETLRWSPDGRYLAFVAALDGPSSDLYSYDTQTRKINRLTDGLNQAATLSWSPDSKWIVHQEVESFGTGAGWGVKAMWAAAPDGSQTKKLYDAPEFTGGENVIGWRAPNTFDVYSFTEMGSQNPRSVNVNTGAAKPINLEVVKSGQWNEIVWSPQTRRFYVMLYEGGIASISLDNQVTHFDGEWLQPSIAPDGQLLAFWGNSAYGPRDGVRLYSLDGELIREVTADPTDFVTWQPDGTGLFYVSDGILYFVSMPDGKAAPIDDGVQVSAEGGIGWVKP